MIDLEERLAAVAALPYGPARLEAAQLVADDADLSGSLEAQFEARWELAGTANFSGARDVALAAIGWLLRAQETTPTLADPHRLVWRYKWVVDNLLLLPTISLETAHQALEDFAVRSRSLGYGENAVAKLRVSQAHLAGELDGLLELDRAWIATERDAMSDCLACDRSERSSWLLDAGRDAEAIEALEPVLDGRLRCTEEPHRGLAKALGPLVRSGNISAAHALHRRGYRLVRDNPSFLAHVGLHLQHLATTGNLGRAARISRDHVEAAESARVPMERLAYATGLLCVLDAAAAAGIETLPLRVPDTSADETDVATLRRVLAQRCEQLADLYDHRNGNTFHRTRLELARRRTADAVDAPLDAAVDVAVDAMEPTGPTDGTEPGAERSAQPEALAMTPDIPRESAEPGPTPPPGTDAADHVWSDWAEQRWRADDITAAQSAWQHVLDRHRDDDEATRLPLQRRVLAARLRLGDEDAGAELHALVDRATALGLVNVAARTLITLGHARIEAGNLDEGGRLLAEGLATGRPAEADDDHRRAHALAAVRHARLLLRSDHPEQAAREQAELGFRLLREVGQDLDAKRDAAAAQLEWALALAGSGSLEEGLAILDAVLADTKGPDADALAQLRPAVLWWRARVLTDLGRPDAASAAWDEVTGSAEEPSRVEALFEAGRGHLQAGRADAAVPRLRQAVALARRREAPLQAVVATRFLAHALVQVGQRDLAIDLLDEAVAETRHLPPDFDVARALISNAELLADLGDAELAVVRLRAARELLTALAHAHGVAVVDEFLGDLLGPDLAVQPLESAAASFEELGVPDRAGRCLRKYAEVENQRGEHQRAAEIAARAQTLLDGDENRRERAIAIRVLAQALAGRGDLDEAGHEARRAAAEAATVGDPEQRYIAEIVLLDCLEEQERHADALQTARTALEALPPDADGGIEFLTVKVAELERRVAGGS